MRLIKSAGEIALLREAGHQSAEALRDTMKATRPGVMEYELAALLQHRYLASGSRDHAYAPIVATGKNIVDPHYCANNSKLEDGELVLVDCAPDFHYYTSDITRIWPVNGTYTPTQRNLYGFVTEYHKALLNAIRPGRMCSEIEDEVADLMAERAKAYEFSTPAQKAGLEKMLACRNHIAHSVGMSVHDGLGHKDVPLKPGMVFAVDPQLWLTEEDLYIRVEDTGVVTETGFEVFTSGITLELDEIEQICGPA
jgi:Xaa-Pro aminopeptidase